MGHSLLGNIHTVGKYGNSTSHSTACQDIQTRIKSYDFVLAFPQAELDVGIWMYLPMVSKLIQNESKCYILKLNKSLYGLKQASLNWFEKLKQGLIDSGFHPSAINPSCLYFKKGMIIITYVDDCIIINNSMKDINTFVKSMKDGPKGNVLTDEGDINKFLGIEIKEITGNKFKLSQPFVIE